VEREKLREIVLQCLHAQAGDAQDEELVTCLSGELKVAKSHIRQALEKAKRVSSEADVLDAVLKRVVTDYDLERIQAVERNILRLALYEVWHEPELPRKVVLAEALRLARKYATPEAAHFVHAVLDQLIAKAELIHGD
jgi:transcription antitermination protein NusB